MTENLFAATLFSSSGGNCLYIKHKGEEFLIDAGISAKAIQASLKTLGSGLENIKAIFITHEHSDHIKGLNTITKKFKTPVFAPSPCREAILKSSPSAEDCLSEIEKETRVDFAETSFFAFETPHDSACSFGYTVDFGQKVLGFSTDMGYITKTAAKILSKCDAVAIESNHDVKMLKDGAYPQSLKDRILGDYGHLSNQDCAQFLPFLVTSGVNIIALAHLSRENNTPEKAFEESYNSLINFGIKPCSSRLPQNGGLACGDVSLEVCPRAGICALIDK
ncbi:MAG: MBL fold metallo-hydrolase [Eubacteriales bacterium]